MFAKIYSELIKLTKIRPNEKLLINDFEKWCKHLPEEGVTSYLVSTYTQADEKNVVSLKNICDYMDRQYQGAEAVGINIEGNFISKNRPGAQEIETIIGPRVDILDKYYQICGNKLLTVTYACEDDDNYQFLNYCLAHKIRASIGHCVATYQQAEDALASTSGYNSLGKHYTEYFDMDSFVNMYILEELTQDIDGGQTSFYLCKDKDNDKFYVAPAWDFDNTLGNDRILSEKVTLSLTNPNTWFVNQNYYSRRDDFTWTQSQIECFFTLAYENQADLRAAVRAQWSEFKKVFNDEFVSFCSAWGERIAPSAVMNNIRWNLTSLNYGEAMAKHMDYANRVTTFLVNKRTALDKGFAENAAIIYYNSNGGIGKVVDGTMYLIGDTVKVKSPDYNIYYALEAPSYDVVFDSWNTAADGSGESYKPGDTITFTSDEIHLYAIWKDPFHQDDNHKVSFWQKIVNFFRKIGDWFAKLFR